MILKTYLYVKLDRGESVHHPPFFRCFVLTLYRANSTRCFVLTLYRANSTRNRQIDEFAAATSQHKSAYWSVFPQFYPMIFEAKLYVK